MLDVMTRTTAMPPKITTSNEDGSDDGFRAIRYGLEGSLLAVAGFGLASGLFNSYGTGELSLGSYPALDLAAAFCGFIAVVSFRYFAKISRS
jgi:hypothetical protein